VDKKRFQTGLKIRGAVLGKDHIRRSFSKGEDISLPLQELITEYVWGTVWARPGLPRKTRSLINIAMLTALNRPHEVKLHLKGAIRNGCSRKEIVEVLLQAAVYCGVPAAVDSFRIANEFFSEMKRTKTEK
jgi:4-carboxymuconolactone decarboxylase